MALRRSRAAFQAAPILALRMAFLDELELIAHSPLEESAAILRQKVRRRKG